jgi:hypothetical protein
VGNADSNCLGSEVVHLLGEVLCGDDELFSAGARRDALAGLAFTPEERSGDGGALAERGRVGEGQVHAQGQRRAGEAVALGQAMAMRLNGQGRHGSREFTPMRLPGCQPTKANSPLYPSLSPNPRITEFPCAPICPHRAYLIPENPNSIQHELPHSTSALFPFTEETKSGAQGNSLSIFKKLNKNLRDKIKRRPHFQTQKKRKRRGSQVG